MRMSINLSWFTRTTKKGDGYVARLKGDSKAKVAGIAG